MKIYNIPPKCYTVLNSNYQTKPSFGTKCPVETITHYNLGIMDSGIIGKVKVLKGSGKEVLVNVKKSKGIDGEETYSLLDTMNNTIGEIIIKIKKFYDYEKLFYSEDPSHVFVDTLRNYSNPNTPYYKKGLEQYKHIGTRLIQIAQRRSDESLCNGNIELIAKNEKAVLDFYKKLGFSQPAVITRFNNPYKMHLPPQAKEPLSRMFGGL